MGTVDNDVKAVAAAVWQDQSEPHMLKRMQLSLNTLFVAGQTMHVVQGST